MFFLFFYFYFIQNLQYYAKHKLLFNIWKGFSVRSWSPSVLWQAVTLWWVNRAARHGVGSNRCLTGRRPRGQILTEAENRKSSQGHAADQRVRSSLPIRLVKGCKRWRSSGSRKKIWEEVLSLSICLSIYLSNQLKTVGPLQE